MSAQRRIVVLLASILAGCGGGGGYGGGNGGKGGVGGGAPTYTIGGTASGLDGTVVLQNNGRDDLSVTQAGGAGPAPFTFATAVENRGAYEVTVKTQPSNQACSVSRGAGTARANITNVEIACSDLPPAALHVQAGVHSATLTWDAPIGMPGFPLGVSSFNVIVETKCPTGSACPPAQLLQNVGSPLTVPELVNGQPYLFTVETVFTNGARGKSNVAAARPDALTFGTGVSAIATAADGTVYLGGVFTEVGVTSGSAVPLDSASGGLSIPDFPIVVGTVVAAESDGAGGWYIGGSFTQVAGWPLRNLAHILASGAVDESFHPNPDQPVLALARSADTLYVGGSFHAFTPEPGGTPVPRNFLAAIGPDGAVDANFRPDPDRLVRALAVSGGTIYVGGSFRLIGNTPRSNLAALDPAGVVDPDFHPDPDLGVNALVLSENALYVGGSFTQFTPDANSPAVPRSFLAALSLAGVPDERFHPDPNAEVDALAISQNALYVGGEFSELKPDPLGAAVPRSFLAAVDLHGALDAGFHPDLDAEVLALAVAGDTLYVGGNFTAVGGAPCKRLAAFSAAGILDQRFHPDPNDRVRVLKTSGTTLFVGGTLSGLGSVSRKRLAATDASGHLLAWDPSANGEVRALAILGDRVVAGGSFTAIGSDTAERKFLAAIDLHGVGAIDANFPSADRRVFALAASDTTLYAGGDFLNIVVGGATPVARSHLAAFDVTGQLSPWEGFADNVVQALAISGNALYAGGGFATLGAGVHKVRRFLGAVDATTGTVLDWNPNPINPVHAIAVSGGAVYAGSRTALMAIREDIAGTLLWTQTFDGPVEALVASADTLYAGGDFTAVGGVTRKDLAAFTLNGSQPSEPLPWDPQAGAPVSALAIRNGAVHVGGFFQTLGAHLRGGFGTVDAAGAGEVIP